ncbi:NADH dehydrogenase subunit 2 (mitochondrion) [Liolophura japonica]|uniref:NADH dehydrogenase subunit 2 n=1 Tax=Liolophura japonica TaxID=13599 RepID=UPI0023D84551|nr:NADH dehydrogenase subunit 2 [Liolophura japonica]WDQ44260.1 NADH dehydrogenase subunit 2 [Liolophura japonica]
MLNFPFVTMFMLIMFSSSIFSLCSTHWFGAWLGLEVNLMSFIPMMVQKGLSEEVESAIKYFLVQAVASALLLLLASMVFWEQGDWSMVSSKIFSSSFIMMSLLLKMGMAPFHFWLPGVISGLSWVSNSLLMTWQKVAPLFLICFFFYISSIQAIMMVLMSSFFGGVGGLNQTSIRGLLAYSSILHNGWMISASLISVEMSFIYLFLYSLILFSALSLFLTEEVKNSQQFLSIFMWSKFSRACFCVTIISLGGMPPLLGFFSKWLVLSKLIVMNILFLPFILILGSMISLYYYLILGFSVILSSSVSWKKMNKKEFFFISMFLVLNLGGICFINYLGALI